MSTLIPRLLASPPALRTETFRQILLSQERTKILLPSRRYIHVLRSAHAYHRPRTQFIIAAERRLESTAATSTSTTTAAPTAETSTEHSAQTKSRARRFLTSSALVLFFFTAGLAMAAAPAAETVNGYVNPTSDAETLHLFHPETQSAVEVNEYIVNHPLAVKLRSTPGMSESRPHMRIPPAMRKHNFTGGTLAGDGKLEVPPLNFNDKGAELPTMTQIMYLGPSLCGHPGVVHGGMLATLLDEGLARACFPALPNKVGVTASLKMDYRAPCPAGSYVVLKAETVKVDGRKAWSKGRIELLGEENSEGKTLVEAEALFIEPKNAKGTVKNIITAD